MQYCLQPAPCNACAPTLLQPLSAAATATGRARGALRRAQALALVCCAVHRPQSRSRWWPVARPPGRAAASRMLLTRAHCAASTSRPAAAPVGPCSSVRRSQQREGLRNGANPVGPSRLPPCHAALVDDVKEVGGSVGGGRGTCASACMHGGTAAARRMPCCLPLVLPGQWGPGDSSAAAPCIARARRRPGPASRTWTKW